MSEEQKQILLEAAKILQNLKESSNVETIGVPVLGGVLKFSSN